MWYRRQLRVVAQNAANQPAGVLGDHAKAQAKHAVEVFEEAMRGELEDRDGRWGETPSAVRDQARAMQMAGSTFAGYIDEDGHAAAVPARDVQSGPGPEPARDDDPDGLMRMLGAMGGPEGPPVAD